MIDLFIRSIQERQEAVRLMRQDKYTLRVHVNEVATVALAQFYEVKFLKPSLEEALSSMKILEVKASSLKYVVMATYT